MVQAHECPHHAYPALAVLRRVYRPCWLVWDLYRGPMASAVRAGVVVALLPCRNAGVVLIRGENYVGIGAVRTESSGEALAACKPHQVP